MKRRDAMRSLAFGALGAGATAFSAIAPTRAIANVATGAAPVRIRDVKTILTAPDGIRLVIVKVETTEPGLYGLGCATFTQRALVVHTAIEKYLKPFLIGRNVDEIEDIWQSSYVSSYWRNGPVLFNAMSGVDIALWDIKGKRANMPLYNLLGGKVRKGADLYFHARGPNIDACVESGRQAVGRGYRFIRLQIDPAVTPTPLNDASVYGGPTNPVNLWDPADYMTTMLELFDRTRSALGPKVELLHDIHERISLPQAINFCKALEQYSPYFIEDPVPPEENDHFRLLRQQTTVPIAMGELFNTQHEYVPLIKDRLIDFIRIHISQIGGLSPARKVQALSEYFGVKTAWHGPGDASPVAHAAQLALELASYNFGIHEGHVFRPNTQEVFPGCPTVSDGYMFAQEKPGLGMDLDEKLAAKFPFPDGPPNFEYFWGTTRLRDGTVIRP